MQKSILNIRTALGLAAGISILMNMLFLIMFFFGREALLPPENEPRPAMDMGVILAHVLSNFAVAFVLYLINFRMMGLGRTGWKRWILIGVITFIMTGALSYIFSRIQIQLQDFGSHPERFIRGSMMRDYVIAVIVVLSSQLLRISEKQQHMEVENKTLLAENIRTRFAALKNQMDPHFLFNSLNTLTSLIRTDPNRADLYVGQLSQVLRYTLRHEEQISLGEELEFTAAYSELMQIRYGEGLNFEVDADPRYSDWLVAPLGIQTLVENAIKHNIVSKKHPLTITIRTEGENIVVENPIQPKKEAEQGEGIGLPNLSERYRLRWDKEISVEREDGIFKVTVPLIEP